MSTESKTLDPDTLAPNCSSVQAVGPTRSGGTRGAFQGRGLNCSEAGHRALSAVLSRREWGGALSRVGSQAAESRTGTEA